MRAGFLLALVCLVGGAVAQKMDPFDYAVSNVSLLQAKPIKVELKISEAQRAKMNKYAEEFNKSMGSMLNAIEKSKDGKPPKDADPKMKAAYEKLKKGVLAQLTPIQLKRLREITLKQVGLPALTDPLVAKRIGIADAQLKLIQSTYEKAVAAAAKIEDSALNVALKDLKARKPKTEKEAKEIMDEANKRAEAVHKKIDPQISKLRKDAEAKVAATLTAAQRSAWEALKGKKYTPK